MDMAIVISKPKVKMPLQHKMDYYEAIKQSEAATLKLLLRKDIQDTFK
jgi:hypothetical protein